MNSVLSCLLAMQTQPCCWRSVALRAHSSASWRQRWCSCWLSGCWIKPEIFEVLCVLGFKAQTLGEKKMLFLWGFLWFIFFSFSNSVLRMIHLISWKGRKILCFVPALCEHLLAYTCNRATCRPVCVTSGYQKCCISQLDLILGVLLMVSRGKTCYLKQN